MRRLLVASLLAGLLLWLIQPQRGPGTAEQSIHAAMTRTEGRPESSQAPPSRQRNSDQDLPPAGTRSLFDHHIETLGSLPYPFAALLESFDPADRWNDGSVSLLIPHGRSLSKAHTDFAHPRVLAAAQNQPPHAEQVLPPLYAGRLFLGYTEAAREIEVIAYNELAGRFEFQLVQDYCAGCSPRVVYARRAVCLACHQAGTPIFSVRPWAETNASMPVARRIAAAREVPWPEASTTGYHGAPLSTQLLMPETFDELVRKAGTLSLAQRLWIDGCGLPGLECRRHVLAQALFLLMRPGEFNPASAANDAVRAMQERSWPADGIAVPNDFIPSRDPLAQTGFWQAPVQRLRELFGRLAGGPLSGARSTDELERKLSAFDRLPKLPAAQDPLTSRPATTHLSAHSLAAVRSLAQFFAPDDRRRLLRWTGNAPEKITAPILAGELDQLLGAKALSRVQVLQALALHLGQPAPAYCCLANAGLGRPQTTSDQPLPIAQNSVLDLFQRYCFACHRGNPIGHLNFMGAASLAELRTAIQAKWQIRDRLDFQRYESGELRSQLMPPAGSQQRTWLDAARARGSDDLQRMQEFILPPRTP